MATRACGVCSACKRCCLRLGNWRGWQLLTCLAGSSCSSCCTACLPSSSAPPAPPPTSAASTGLPSTQQGVPFKQVPESTLEKLMEDMIPLIQHQVDRLDSSTATSSSSYQMVAKWEEMKGNCTSFIDTLPKQLTDEVAGNGRSLFMPLLSNFLGGLGGVHWLGIGFLFISWSLDSISNVKQNRADCIGNLRCSLRLLKITKEIWQATSNIHVEATLKLEVLQNSVERAVRCASFCTSNLDDALILRCLKANTVKDAVDKIATELDRACSENTQFMGLYGIKSKFQRQPTLSPDRDILVAGQKVVEDAVTYLKTSSDDIMAICLHGMGGIGKSTLGLKIFAEFQKTKYRDCRVELQFETKPGELCDIQKQILEKVCKHAASPFANLTDGKSNMERELKQINDPIFLYVDNVLEPHYLTDLLPKSSFFPKGSRILITSRERNIRSGIVGLGIKNYKLVEVQKLQEQEAQQLLWEQFESKGQQHRDISAEVESFEKRVLALCDGLPLALVVVGKYINATENGLEKVEVWRQVVHHMENAEPFGGGKNDELYSHIMFSIQKLDQNVKRAFLDVISLVEGLNSWESIKRAVENDNYLEVLRQRALVRKSGFCSTSTIEIHDVIKAMGKRMVEDDNQELRITVMNKFEELHSTALKKVVALGYVTDVDAYRLKEMPRLRLLTDVHVRGGECQEIKLRHLRVVHRLRCSATNVFDWSECASLKEVSVFRMYLMYPTWRSSNIRLEALTLECWRQLKDVDGIETLTCLKKLRFCFCTEIKSLPEGISRLTGLSQLQLEKCGKLKGLPPGISSLICLEVLKLNYCTSVQSLPDGLASLTGLTELDLSGCGSLQGIPEGLASLTGLTRLDLSRCKSLQGVPEGLASLTGLTELHLSGCQGLQGIPEGWRV